MSARIVIADDDSDIRRLVSFTLRRRGYTVHEASTGDAALLLIQQERPQLAVLDVMMPGLTGLEVTRRLAADPGTAAIPVIILSAKGQASEIEEGRVSGARAYLIKPFVPQQLAEQVAVLLAEPRGDAQPQLADALGVPRRSEPPAGETAAEQPGAPATSCAQKSGHPLSAALTSTAREGTVRCVLVVDDDPHINRLVGTRLTARGYQVESAANGEEALACLRENSTDLIFLDVAMPGVGGLDVLDAVRAEGRDLAVIMMTAFGSEEIAINALRRGADDYLRKPFEPREFAAVLDRTVSRLELTRQNAALRRQLDEQHHRLQREVAAAGAVQEGLLPRTYPTLPGFELAGRVVPAREVGGDFYDWQCTDGDLLSLTVGDVMGKGMPAALLMATTRAALRSVASVQSPASAVQLTAAALDVDLAHSGSFVTLFHAQLDPRTGALCYVDAGHGHALVRRASGRVETLRTRGLPLGILAEERYVEGSLILRPGDALIVHSDGLVDACPEGAAEPSVLAESVRDTESAERTVERLVGLARSDQPLPDDLTVVVLRRLVDPPSSPSR